MGIYIKNMKMPTSCESCPCKTSNAFGGLGCQATGYILLLKANQDHPDNCPLIPVPEHGRLIDADALIDVFRGFIAMYDSRPFSLPDIARRNELRFALTEVINAPTIIPVSEEDEI